MVLERSDQKPGATIMVHAVQIERLAVTGPLFYLSPLFLESLRPSCHTIPHPLLLALPMTTFLVIFPYAKRLPQLLTLVYFGRC